MKNILVLMHDDAGQEARLQAALDVTRAVEGHLTCLDVEILPVLMGDFYSGAGEAMLMEDERVREQANRVAVEARLAKEMVSWDWITTAGTIAPCLTERAALADLVILNRRLEDFPYPDMQAAAGETVLKAGRPVLAVPAHTRGVNVCGTALVCWDGSSASVAALRAAIPLLRLAETVVLLAVEDGSIALPVEDAADYLSRHDIAPMVRKERPANAKPLALIQEAIRHHGADYVVMGGFSHSRLAEAILGGVTRGMLTSSPVPVLFAH